MKNRASRGMKNRIKKFSDLSSFNKEVFPLPWKVEIDESGAVNIMSGKTEGGWMVVAEMHPDYEALAHLMVNLVNTEVSK